MNLLEVFSLEIYKTGFNFCNKATKTRNKQTFILHQGHGKYEVESLLIFISQH